MSAREPLVSVVVPVRGDAALWRRCWPVLAAPDVEDRVARRPR
ncbi:MAG: hypothetical protein R2708_25960 [Vicinamibacterales bacterium]